MLPCLFLFYYYDSKPFPLLLPNKFKVTETGCKNKTILFSVQNNKYASPVDGEPVLIIELETGDVAHYAILLLARVATNNRYYGESDVSRYLKCFNES